jgi:hypothetical protein
MGVSRRLWFFVFAWVLLDGFGGCFFAFLKAEIFEMTMENQAGLGVVKKKGLKGWALREQGRKKRLFLKLFLRSGMFEISAKGADSSETTVRRWMKEDEKFAASFKQVRALYIEGLESEADRRGARGMPRLRFYQGQVVLDPRTGKALVEREYSDALLMFRLRALKPRMYRESGVVGDEEKVHVKLYRGVDVEQV